MAKHIRTSGSESWKNLQWKEFQKQMFRLQRKIYEAVQVEDMVKATRLQKLLMRSRAAQLLAIRQVTQLNAGARKPLVLTARKHCHSGRDLNS